MERTRGNGALFDQFPLRILRFDPFKTPSKEKKQWVGGVFHLYDEYAFKGEERHDTGEIAETNYLWLSNKYISNINARYVRPLDYGFLASLENDVASRMYEILSPRFYGLGGKGYYHVDYLNLCNMLPLTPERYYSAVKRRLKPAHNELGRRGYLSKVHYVLYNGSKEVKTVRYYPGERAKREMRGEIGSYAKPVLIEEQLELPIAQEIPLTGLAKELYERGIRPEAKAQKLAERYPDGRIHEILDMYDADIIGEPGGIIRALEEDWQPTEKQIKSAAIAKQEQNARSRKERWKEERQKRIDEEVRDWDKIPPEKRVDSMFKFWLLAKKVDENSEAARMRKQEYIDKLPKSKADIQKYIDEKVVLIEPPEDFE